MKDSLQNLILAYHESPSAELQRAIIIEAMPLVRSIIGKIHYPNTPFSQYEDLVSVGIQGLLQALDLYDPKRNVQLHTFAYYHIRGNVIDYLRKIDRLPRVKHSLYGRTREATSRLMQILGREPRDDEIAAELEITIEEYHDLLATIQRRTALSMNDHRYNDYIILHLTDCIENKNVRTPSDNLENENVYNLLACGIRKLKERDQLILAMYYYEEMTLDEIAQVFCVTQACISQIIGKLLLQLRHVLQ